MLGVLVKERGRPRKFVDLNREWVGKRRKKGITPVYETDWAFCRLLLVEEKMGAVERKRGKSEKWAEFEKARLRALEARWDVVGELLAGVKVEELAALRAFILAKDESLRALARYLDENGEEMHRLRLDALSLKADIERLIHK